MIKRKKQVPPLFVSAFICAAIYLCGGFIPAVSRHRSAARYVDLPTPNFVKFRSGTFFFFVYPIILLQRNKKNEKISDKR